MNLELPLTAPAKVLDSQLLDRRCRACVRADRQKIKSRYPLRWAPCAALLTWQDDLALMALVDQISPTIIVDTRERRPYDFDGAITKALATGDYSILGLEDRIGIERKSLPDLLSVIGQSRPRFERELERLAQIQFPALVIEASLDEALQATRHSSIHWNAVLGSLCSWSVRLRLSIWFCRNRRLTQLVTERLLTKATKRANEGI